LYENYIKVLYIDLTHERVKVELREDLKKYLGGVGVASKLLEEKMDPNLDALDTAQPIVFATGVLSSIFPVVTKTAAMFKSPLTGELGESYAGGRMALTMQMAGYDAMVITGRSNRMTYLSINAHDISFKDARAFKGVSTNQIGRLIREREPGAGKRSILRVGPAGENQVKYASVCVDTYRHFGRLGLGAVFGSKNLKAISITGDKSIPIQDPVAYLKAYNNLYNKTTDTELMTKYHDLGTPVNVEPLSIAGGLPTLNLQKTSLENPEVISGETFAEEHLVRKVACTGCPVGCIHIGQYRVEFDKGYEFESISVAYDYELIFALGSFLGIIIPKDILRLIEMVEEEGLDAISSGIVLGWATEAFANGLITINETLVPLEFGNTDNYLKALEFISERTNEFYSYLGDGAAAASQKYGGSGFAMSIAGNEMAGYHTGYGSLVGAAVGARHSHLCNGGYSVDQSMKEFDKNKMVDALLKEEIERCMLNSLTICLFARKVYDRDTILMALRSIGWADITDQDLSEIGREIYKTKLRIKKSIGFDVKNVKLADRFFQTPSMTGVLERETANELIALYDKKCEDLLNEMPNN
jgi:aldehyde:ferredoxin oxidoreductase